MIISKELTIKTIDKVWTEYLNEVSSEEKVLIQSDEVKSIDISGIQFLIFAIKSSIESNKKISFKIKLTPEVKALLERNGFKDILSHINNN
jgi:anti-anti-sigma regulatory factor